ncbi:hypothetical protein [Clostridium pasteurianum]|uniref:Uncharacterized protein n=1 Tax=Clostridium pasteurianum BC1 TaxID=86416 RepID=R4K071_CLOPA|nr:hypothetical protein [Clostridium pasteurianum]AGK95181.1 hypothetical protein Clopa_0081 [Clostridium pasteurianum BC1]
MNKTEMLVATNQYTGSRLFLENLRSIKKGRSRFYIDTRTKIINEQNHIYPLAITGKSVYIVCCYCGRIHSHSCARGKYEGFVAPHCLDNSKHSGYYIEPVEFKILKSDVAVKEVVNKKVVISKKNLIKGGSKNYEKKY